MRYILTILCFAATLSAQEPATSTAGSSAQPATRLEVSGTLPGLPGAAAGIQPGDILFTYDGYPVSTRQQLNDRKAAVKTDSVNVVFVRAGKTIPVRLPQGALGIYFDEFLPDLVLDPDAKVIPGVARLGWTTGKENSFMAALEAAMQRLGVSVDYEYLCGVSGCAFRTQFFDTWCPSSPDPGVGFDATVPALAACGYRGESYALATDGKNKPEIIQAVKTAIDAGIPVLAIDLIEMPEWGVITGYQKQGEEFIVRTYFDSRKNYDIAGKFPFAVVVPVKTGPMLEKAPACRNGYHIALENLQTEKYGEYYSGLAAFSKWVGRLETDDFTKLDSATFANVVQANFWIYNRLLSDRRVGVSFLNRIAGELPGQKLNLDKLARLYTQEAELLSGIVVKIPGPGALTRASDWTREQRLEQAATLNQALALETQAVPVWQELTKPN